MASHRRLRPTQFIGTSIKLKAGCEFHSVRGHISTHHERTAPYIGNDNHLCFSNFRSYEKISKSSVTRHCQSHWVPAICHSTKTT